tara:strand:- start:199 stop:591 length:393 start_codon:yes stop_codon:yes gene_type:complete
MVHTVTMLPDHKGNSKPKSLGDEYYVDIIVDISDYEGTTEIFASDCGLSTINAATLTGQWTTSSIYLFRLLANNDGYYRSNENVTGNSTSFDIQAVTHDASDSTNDRFIAGNAGSIADIGGVRCRVWGYI